MATHERFESLINIAERDLRSARILSEAEKPEIENSCYFCQQCAEKALKAFLSFNNIQYKFTHNLETLCIECQELDNSFLELRNQCDILNSYSTESRYVDDCCLSQDDMQEAINLADEVLVFVKNKTMLKG